MNAKEISLGGLKAGGVIATTNILILIVLKVAGYDEYPKDMISGEVMLFGQFTMMMVLTCCIAGTVGAFVWMWMHGKWGDGAWVHFGVLALILATLETLWTCGILTGTSAGSEEARVVVGVLHYSTALLGGFWLIPHFSPTGCTCGMCPICNADTED
jgi:hypothetical protein